MTVTVTSPAMQQETLAPSPTRLLQPSAYYVTPVDTSARLGSDSSAVIDIIVEIRRVDNSIHSNRSICGYEAGCFGSVYI